VFARFSFRYATAIVFAVSQAGCALHQKSSINLQTPAQSTVATPATPQVISASARVGSQVFATARTSDSICNVSVARVDVVRFESSRFLVRLAAGDPCTKRFNASEVWLNAGDVVIDDSAYVPALARVFPQSNLRIAMAYVGNKIFCDEKGACRINEPLYANARCYAAPGVVAALSKAAQLLAERDATLTLKVLDCYRPIYVQERMFSLVADPKWVAQPKPPRYGGHNRAVAIDLTLEKNGVEFDMGTAFDAFDEKSEWHDDGRGITAEQQRNRRLLRTLMIDAGFRPYDGEWWHFSLPIDAPALNLPL
jgi:D-alanyl-D-alanine dipeptidase